MKLHPILAALRKHKSGVVLIALQIALTLAIVCNAIFIIGKRIEQVNRPTGLEESNLFLVTQVWVGAPTGADSASTEKLDSLLQQDLAIVRRIPGVTSVTPINSMPLLRSSWSTVISTQPTIQFKNTSSYRRAALYFPGQHGLKTLGLQLVAGRDFKPSEITHGASGGGTTTPTVILTQALAKRLFGDANALGKTVYLNGKNVPSRVTGIVARMQTPATRGSFNYNSVILPKRVNNFFSRYAVRTQPGQLQAVMPKVAPALYKANPLRMIDPDDGVRSFAAIRADAYKADIGMAILMSIICVILIAITAAGIVGLTSFWVGQRRKQIGVRRALGATKSNILHYFQIENLLIAGGGAVLGIVLAVGLNLVLMQHMAMDRLPIAVVLAGVVLVLVLGQLAVFVPARRAADVPPALATRTV